jgi:hypothetical protein
MSVDIIKIDDEYFCHSPLLFYLLVQQKKLKTAAPLTTNTLKTAYSTKNKPSLLSCLMGKTAEV